MKKLFKKHRLLNKRGFSMIQLFFYVTFLIVLTVLGGNMLSMVNGVNQSSMNKMKFYAEKNQVYAQIERQANAMESIKVTPNGVTYTTNGQHVSFALTEKGLTYTQEGVSQTYPTITDVNFEMIEEVCYEEEGKKKCQKLENFLQVVLASEKDIGKQVQLNRSRRGFYLGNEQTEQVD